MVNCKELIVQFNKYWTFRSCINEIFTSPLHLTWRLAESYVYIYIYRSVPSKSGVADDPWSREEKHLVLSIFRTDHEYGCLYYLFVFCYLFSIDVKTAWWWSFESMMLGNCSTYKICINMYTYIYIYMLCAVKFDSC